MLTDEDTTKIVNKVIEANKQLFYTKDEMDNNLEKRFEGLRKDFASLQASVESFAAGTKKNDGEIKAVNKRVDDHETWINRASPKIGVEFRP